MTRTAVSLQHSGERRGEVEEDVQDRIREMRQRWDTVLTLLTPTNLLHPPRLCAAEVRAEAGDRAVQRLQGEADLLQGALLAQTRTRTRLEEDMAGLVDLV